MRLAFPTAGPLRSALAVGLVLTFLAGAAPAQNPPTTHPGGVNNNGGGGGDGAETGTGDTADDAVEGVTTFLENLKIEVVWRNNSNLDLLIVLAAAVVGLLVGRVLGWGLQRLGQPLKRRGRRSEALWLTAAAGPATLALFAAALSGSMARLTLSDALRSFTADTLTMLFAVAVVWYLYNLVELLDIALRRIVGRRKTGLEGLLVPIIRKTFRALLVFVAVLFILDAVYQLDVGAWLAGLGIAGLAVSLAAQDSLKNVFGSITIFLDRPFLKDSFIHYGGRYGWVEDMGFRSTRMRTLDGHLLIIPNASIVNQDIENVGVRPYIRRVIDITITYDTPPEKVRRAREIVEEIFQLDGIREAIHNDQDPADWPPRVYFSGFNAASLNILAYYWHRPGDWWPYLDHATRFNQELLERFNAEGIDFAFPTQTLHLAGDENRPLNVGVHASHSAAPVQIAGNNAAQPPGGPASPAEGAQANDPYST